MRNVILALALTTALATPAAAVDGAPYVGVEGGILFVSDHRWDYTDANVDINRAFTIGHRRGFDVDAIAGYDFGSFRIEGEVAYKRASVRDIRVNSGISGSTGITEDSDDGDGRSTALSVMVNGLLDFGEGRFSGYLGGGVGAARVNDRIVIDSIDRSFRGRDSGLAYQGLAGVRYAATPNVELGLKYRFFTVPKVRYEVDGPTPFEIDGNKWRSSSLLASLVYNFAAPVVVAPPVVVEPAPAPAPAPATQTCPDGSVILATDVCPPPPPPPPAPAPERG